MGHSLDTPALGFICALVIKVFSGFALRNVKIEIWPENASSNIDFALKVPKYLSETWGKADDSGIVGSLKISKYASSLLQVLSSYSLCT